MILCGFPECFTVNPQGWCQAKYPHYKSTSVFISLNCILVLEFIVNWNTSFLKETLITEIYSLDISFIIKIFLLVHII